MATTSILCVDGDDSDDEGSSENDSADSDSGGGSAEDDGSGSDAGAQAGEEELPLEDLVLSDQEDADEDVEPDFDSDFDSGSEAEDHDGDQQPDANQQQPGGDAGQQPDAEAGGGGARRRTVQWFRQRRDSPLCPGCSVSVEQMCYLVLRMQQQHHMRIDAIDSFLRVIAQLLLPEGNLLPRSVYLMRKIIG